MVEHRGSEHELAERRRAKYVIRQSSKHKNNPPFSFKGGFLLRKVKLQCSCTARYCEFLKAASLDQPILQPNRQ